MIVYKSLSGEGFNPLLPFSSWLNSRLRLRLMTWPSRIIAASNTLISIGLLLFSAFWISGNIYPSAHYLAIATVVIVVWRLISHIALQRHYVHVTAVPEMRAFRMSLFTLEWVVFYMAMSLYLMVIQTLDVHKLLHFALIVLTGFYALMILVPFAQGSQQALRYKSYKNALHKTPARTKNPDPE